MTPTRFGHTSSTGRVFGAWRSIPSQPRGFSATRFIPSTLPRNDRNGCLQDGHWSEGLIGYFPTYTLGNVYAAQLYDAADEAIGPLEEAFAAGDFLTLQSWLTEHVHRHGQRYSVASIIERATGRPPDPTALVASLERRYRPETHRA